MPVGELAVLGGARKLLEADFQYNVAAWKPDLRYSSADGAGDLILEQPARRPLPAIRKSSGPAFQRQRPPRSETNGCGDARWTSEA